MTLLLTRRDVADLLTIDDAIGAVENAFRLLGRGEVPRPAIASRRRSTVIFSKPSRASRASSRFTMPMTEAFWR